MCCVGSKYEFECAHYSVHVGSDALPRADGDVSCAAGAERSQLPDLQGLCSRGSVLVCHDVEENLMWASLGMPR